MNTEITAKNKIEELEREIELLREENTLLRNEMSRYKSMFDLSPFGIVMIDKKGHVLDVNDRLTDWLGYDTNEVIGKNLLVLPYLPARSKAIVIKNFTKRMLGIQIKPYELEFISIEGKTLVGRIIAQVIKDEKNNSIGEIVLIENISEIKHAEEVTRESEEKFQILTDMVPSAVFIIQEDSFVYANTKTEELFGFKFQELQGLNFFDMLQEDFRENVQFIFDDVLKNFGHVSDFEVKLFTAGSEELWLNISVSHLEFDGNPAIIVTGFDKSTLKKSEDQLKLYTEELKNLNQSKDKFFSIIAHDLKSPFSALLGYSDFLAHDLDDLEKEEVVEYSKNINDVAKNVYDLLENLLEWSRIQTGRLNFKPEEFDYLEVIDQVIYLFKDTAKNKNMRLLMESESEISLFADRNMLYTVVRNLVSNAIKFTEKGGKITIKTRDDGSYLYISVIDTGIGMTTDDLNKIFKIDESHTTIGTGEEKGTGLGLLLCKELVEKNGGELKVESEKGVGSDFTFSIPIKSAE